jgi:hypothetical protein
MNYKLGRIKWIEQEYSWPLDGSRNGPNEWAQRRPAHRNDEDGAEAAAPPGPLEHVPRGVPGLRRSPAGSRRRRRGSCGERVPVDDNGAGIGGDLAVGELVGGGPVHVSRGRWAESITWAV